MGKKLTHEEFVNRIKLMHPEIEFVSKYINAKTRIKCKCKICDYCWETTPDSLNQGCGCPNCANKIKRKCKLKKHEIFVKELSSINPNIEVLEKYTNARTKIKIRCLIDNHIWYATPDNLLHGYGCPKCAGKCRTTKLFRDELFLINPDIEILDEYINNSTKIKCYCKKHKHIWYPTPSHLLQGGGCVYCKKDKISALMKSSKHEFATKLSNVNNKIQVIGNYKDSHTKILVKCMECGREWYINPNNALIRGVKCTCNKKNNISHGELRIFEILQKYSVVFIYQFSFNDLYGVNGGTLSYDFIIQNKNILIEFQGEQHEKPIDYFGGQEKFKIQQEHDKRKRDYAKEHNIELLEIWYWDFENIETILQERLGLKAS